MTPWSETSQKQRNSIYTALFLSVLCAAYSVLVRQIVVVNGQSRFFDCLSYAINVMSKATYDGVDEKPFLWA